MNNDIKEILDYSRKYMTIEDCIRLSKVEDYITNLQEENEESEEAVKYWQNQCDLREKIIDEAIDKLYCYGEVFDRKILQQFQKEMLDILQGADNE